MTETPHLHLTKDASTDYYSVERVNANSDKIDTFAGEVSGRVSALENALNQTEYTTPELHDNTEGKVTIQSGGYIMLGNICVINVRIKTTAQLLGAGIFKNLPTPVAAEVTQDFPASSSVVAVTNHKGLGITITIAGNMVFASTSLPIAADTVICMSAIYPCVLPS